MGARKCHTKNMIGALLIVLLISFPGGKPSGRTTANPIPALPPSARADKLTQSRLAEVYGKLPLSFEANVGQTDGRVKFLSSGTGYRLFLTQDEAVLSLRKSGDGNQEPGDSRAPSASASQLNPSSAILQAPRAERSPNYNGPPTEDSILRI